MEKIGKKIRELRESLNLSQRKFGEKIGLSGKTICSYETGRVMPTLYVLEKISYTYNVAFVRSKVDLKSDLELRLFTLENAIAELKMFLFEKISL